MIDSCLAKIFSEIEKGNNLGEKITLVGATKMQTAETINYAIKKGLKVVAENKVQEFREKTALISGAEQQFIGHLQTNKVKYLVGKVSLIQSVDSLHLAKAISDEGVKKGVVQDILCEINVGKEITKSGFPLENFRENVQEISKLPNIKIKGLMAMLPPSEDSLLLASLCKKMRAIYEQLNAQGYNLSILSMGMSADYKIAIENGSNMIRLGSQIFGKRNYEVKDNGNV